jgi:hypothetical protein
MHNLFSEAKSLSSVTVGALQEGRLVNAVLDTLPKGCKVWMGSNEDIMVEFPIEPLERRRNKGSYQDNFTKVRFGIKANRDNVRSFLVACKSSGMKPGMDLDAIRGCQVALQRSRKQFQSLDFSVSLG